MTVMTMPRVSLCAVCVVLAMVSAAAAQDHAGADPYRRVCQLCHGSEGRGDLGPTLVPLGVDADYVACGHSLRGQPA